MKKILECLSGHDGVWVVGGAVRDLLLGVEPRDIDLLVHEGVALPLLALIEQHHNAKPFLIKEAFGVWRFQLGTLALDIATFTDTLESDLAKRDFTINAMALKIDDYLSGSAEQIIAPFMGKRHLELGIIEPVGPHSIMADPVRILRCARFQAERGMSSSLALNGQARSYAEKLKDCPGERLWSEVKLIMNAPFALRGLDWLDEIGALAVLFPEMEAEKGVVQNEFHHFEVFEHSRRALAHYLDIWEKADFLDPNVQECVANYQETTLMSNLAVYKLAAFLHDIGKPSAKGYRSDGKVTFYKHEQLGAELASKIIRRMAMSNFEGKVLVQFIRWHTYMAKLARVPKLDNGHLCSAGRRLGIVSIPVALFGAADLLAKKIDMAPDQLIYRNVTATINRFLKAHCFQRTEIIDPPLPVTGADLVAVLGIPPGRWVADTIIFLKEEVAAGRIAGRQEAINAAKKLNRYKYGK